MKASEFNFIRLSEISERIRTAFIVIDDPEEAFTKVTVFITAMQMIGSLKGRAVDVMDWYRDKNYHKAKEEKTNAR